MKVFRTPDEQFLDLPDFPFAPHYLQVQENLRLHYLDEGPRTGPPVLLMHGEPSWCFLYRKMIPILVAAGCRVVAPDLIGFGRSDKPGAQTDYSYSRHLQWTTSFLDQLDLRGIHLFCQDWGGLIGLRIVAAHLDRFESVIVANTFLPDGTGEMPEAFMKWRSFSQINPEFSAGAVVKTATVQPLPEAVQAAYDAPFPNELYKAGARAFPMLVPLAANDPEATANAAAWKILATYNRPFLTLFSDSDPITAGMQKVFQRMIPGARHQPHAVIPGAGHFLQEDQGELIAEKMVQFLKKIEPSLEA